MTDRKLDTPPYVNRMLIACISFIPSETQWRTMLFVFAKIKLISVPSAFASRIKTEIGNISETNLVKGRSLSKSALQEVAVGTFVLEVREVFGDPHVKPIESGQNKIWPRTGK